MKGHKKHTNLSKPNAGKFHKHEWSIIGAPCSRILEISNAINDQLKDQFHLAYLDDDHNVDEVEDIGFKSAIQNRIKHYSFIFKEAPTEFTYKNLLKELDAVLLNGNHYTARKQIVLINEKKKESLSKKLDRLTDVEMIIYDQGVEQVYDYLEEIVETQKPAIYSIDEMESIAKDLGNKITEGIAPMMGLVLAGGKSMRMGTDKSALKYHGVDQLSHSVSLLGKFCAEVKVSVAKQADDETRPYDFVEDSFSGLGPFGGILSAFRLNPNAAIMVLPCDVPLVDEALLQELVSRRNPSKVATCFHNPSTNFPEPLITIWEPKAYGVLLQFLSQGYSCPRKVLINTNIEEVHTASADKMMNVNTKEERERVLGIIGGARG